jgi:hypothetical protein
MPAPAVIVFRLRRPDGTARAAHHGRPRLQRFNAHGCYYEWVAEQSVASERSNGFVFMPMTRLPSTS